ncbi:MAG TPA: VCBS repeat-containing protein, partial [Byssovorax sp.]
AVVGALVGFAGPIAGVAVADLDGDGLLDVAATDATAGVVRTARGAGDGTLVASNDLDAGADPLAVVAADLDGDGRADLAVACAAPPSLLVFTAR